MSVIISSKDLNRFKVRKKLLTKSEGNVLQRIEMLTMFTSWEVVAGELSEFRKWRLVTRVVTVNSSTGVIMTLVCGHWSAMTLTTENDWLQCNVVTGVLTTETCHVTRDNVGVVLVMVLHWSKITDAETKLSVGEDEGRVALLLQHKNIINNEFWEFLFW